MISPTRLNLVSLDRSRNEAASLIEQALANNKPCLAERVADAGRPAFLWQHGIDLVQGNFVQQPDSKPGREFHGAIARGA